MDKKEKQESVSQIKALVEKSTTIYLVDYSGVNVEDINLLRREFLKESVTYKVFKNTLLNRVFKEIGSGINCKPESERKILSDSCRLLLQ